MLQIDSELQLSNYVGKRSSEWYIYLRIDATETTYEIAKESRQYM